MTSRQHAAFILVVVFLFGMGFGFHLPALAAEPVAIPGCGFVDRDRPLEWLVCSIESVQRQREADRTEYLRLLAERPAEARVWQIADTESRTTLRAWLDQSKTYESRELFDLIRWRIDRYNCVRGVAVPAPSPCERNQAPGSEAIP